MSLCQFYRRPKSTSGIISLLLKGTGSYLFAPLCYYLIPIDQRAGQRRGAWMLRLHPPLPPLSRRQEVAPSSRPGGQRASAVRQLELADEAPEIESARPHTPRVDAPPLSSSTMEEDLGGASVV